jgi:hypothetical protein
MHIWSRVHMLPLLKNTFENVKKFQTKFYVYISTDYVRITKFHNKSMFVVLWVKKIKKKISRKPLFYHRILSFFA